ncbi:MAG: hypothetical protein HYV68_01790 [Candidatus Taylorbacteria bacterium]|nr:hypothetical protein [Candidatus Taylorbacteria bacterium]
MIKSKKNRKYVQPASPSRTRTLPLDQYARISMPFSVLIIALGLIAYVALTSLTVWNTAKRAEAEEILAVRSSLVSDLESKLAAINGNITETLAHIKGFKDSSSIKYLSAKPLSRADLNANQLEI